MHLACSRTRRRDTVSHPRKADGIYEPEPGHITQIDDDDEPEIRGIDRLDYIMGEDTAAAPGTKATPAAAAWLQCSSEEHQHPRRWTWGVRGITPVCEKYSAEFEMR